MIFNVFAQDRPHAFVRARIEPVGSPAIPEGLLVIQNGRIDFVGTFDKSKIPEGAEIRDVSGKVILPGLVDTHSHVGGAAGADRSGPIQPEVRVMDALNPRDPGFRRAVAGGLTTINVMPGSGHLSSGQTVYLKPKRSGQIEKMAIRTADGGFAGGLKMANGTNPQRDPPFPQTRGKNMALVRERFVAARDYQAKMKRAETDPEKKPPRDLALETLVEVLEKRRVVHHHTHRHDDILTVLRLANEFDFRVVLHHVSEAWKVAQEIADAKIPCSVIVIDSPGGKLEAQDLSLQTCGVLERAGAMVAIHTDDWITDSRFFLRSAALAIRGGFSRKGALESLTIQGARMLDLDARVGSLEAGKDADFVILSGDPFAISTQVLETWIEGERVFDRTNPEDLLYATGGYGAGKDQSVYLCCCEEEAR